MSVNNTTIYRDVILDIPVIGGINIISFSINVPLFVSSIQKEWIAKCWNFDVLHIDSTSRSTYAYMGRHDHYVPTCKRKSKSRISTSQIVQNSLSHIVFDRSGMLRFLWPQIVFWFGYLRLLPLNQLNQFRLLRKLHRFLLLLLLQCHCWTVQTTNYKVWNRLLY